MRVSEGNPAWSQARGPLTSPMPSAHLVLGRNGRRPEVSCGIVFTRLWCRQSQSRPGPWSMRKPLPCPRPPAVGFCRGARLASTVRRRSSCIEVCLSFGWWGLGFSIREEMKLWGLRVLLLPRRRTSSQEMSSLGQGRVSLHPLGFSPERPAGGDLLVKSCLSLNDTEAPHLRLGPPCPPRPLSVPGLFIEADKTGGTLTPRPTSHRGTAGALEIRPLTVPSALEAETGREPLRPGLSTRHPRPARGLYGSRKYLWEMVWTFMEQKLPILE